MHASLEKLGLSVLLGASYEHQFGVTLRATTPVEITKTSNLQALKVVTSIHSEGDFIMMPFYVAMDTSLQGSEVVQITANTSKVKSPRDVTLCVISSDKTENQYVSYLIWDIAKLLPKKDRPKMHSEVTDASKLAGTKIIRQPKHGQVEFDGTRLGLIRK